MTTRVTIKNENDGIGAKWDVLAQINDGEILAILKPGEDATVNLWHDGRALLVREIPLK